jgi:hypothetical protein
MYYKYCAKTQCITGVRDTVLIPGPMSVLTAECDSYLGLETSFPHVCPVLTLSPSEIMLAQFLKAVFRHLFSPAAHPNLSRTHDGTPQNFASRKRGTKLYMAINMYLRKIITL